MLFLSFCMSQGGTHGLLYSMEESSVKPADMLVICVYHVV